MDNPSTFKPIGADVSMEMDFLYIRWQVEIAKHPEKAQEFALGFCRDLIVANDGIRKMSALNRDLIDAFQAFALMLEQSRGLPIDQYLVRLAEASASYIQDVAQLLEVCNGKPE